MAERSVLAVLFPSASAPGSSRARVLHLRHSIFQALFDDAISLEAPGWGAAPVVSPTPRMTGAPDLTTFRRASVASCLFAQSYSVHSLTLGSCLWGSLRHAKLLLCPTQQA